MTTSSNAPSLPYHEPSIATLLIVSSFLLLLNVVNYYLDRYLYCGLLGQILVGIAWGRPGTKWLSSTAEEFVVQIGYLGLILLVYEGGLTTSFSALRANLSLAAAVAATGICVPIGLSFTLQGMLGATALQAFAAGAALCSTSLGTTFTVLRTSGLTTTRLGVVLSGAAMMDDIVGLVMVQVIANLGASGSSIDPLTIIRPVAVSLGFAVVVPVVCRFVVTPATVWLNGVRQRNSAGALHRTLATENAAFALHTTILLGMAAGATYAGTSNLFAAYIAGAAISWWDTEVPHVQLPGLEHQSAESSSPETAQSKEKEDAEGHQGNEIEPCENHGLDNSNQPTARRQSSASLKPDLSGSAIFEEYYQQPVEKVFKPFFFASIGFSIPITKMFDGPVLWRGIIYAILMAFSKLVCGLWLVRFSASLPLYVRDKLRATYKGLSTSPRFWNQKREEQRAPAPHPEQRRQSVDPPSAPSAAEPHVSDTQRSSPPRPLSLYPAAILGAAMVSRGEIGFLVAALAASTGVFSRSGSTSANDTGHAPTADSDIFLVVTWAIVLCTVLGPLSVGVLVRRVRWLEKERDSARARQARKRKRTRRRESWEGP